MLKEQEQPTIYENEGQLIEWFEWNLYQQRLEIATSKNISFDETKTDDDIDEYLKTQIDNKELELNIGSYYEKITVDFEFGFRFILEKLGITNKDERENIIFLIKYTTFSENVSFITPLLVGKLTLTYLASFYTFIIFKIYSLFYISKFKNFFFSTFHKPC